MIRTYSDDIVSVLLLNGKNVSSIELSKCFVSAIRNCIWWASILKVVDCPRFDAFGKGKASLMKYGNCYSIVLRQWRNQMKKSFPVRKRWKPECYEQDTLWTWIKRSRLFDFNYGILFFIYTAYMYISHRTYELWKYWICNLSPCTAKARVSTCLYRGHA